MKPSVSYHTHNGKSLVGGVIKIDCRKTIPAVAKGEHWRRARHGRRFLQRRRRVISAESDKH